MFMHPEVMHKLDFIDSPFAFEERKKIHYNTIEQQKKKKMGGNIQVAASYLNGLLSAFVE